MTEVLFSLSCKIYTTYLTMQYIVPQPETLTVGVMDRLSSPGGSLDPAARVFVAKAAARLYHESATRPNSPTTG